MLFRSRQRPEPVDLKLGARSPLVMAKLGYDLRAHYIDTLQQPFPDEIGKVVQQLTQGEELASPDRCGPEEHRSATEIEGLIVTETEETGARG